MFSGIVQAKGAVVATERRGVCKAVTIEKPRGWKLTLGQSISVDGICSTVVRSRAGSFEVEYMPETLSKTTAGRFEKHSVLNLERSLTLRDYVDGHLVMGHVDAAVRVTDVARQKNSTLVTVAVPSRLEKYLPRQGSVALNGVSLTIARAKPGYITVALIPHTLSATNLGNLSAGSTVNVEIDMIARYTFAAKKRGSTMQRHAKKKDRA